MVSAPKSRGGYCDCPGHCFRRRVHGWRRQISLVVGLVLGLEPGLWTRLGLHARPRERAGLRQESADQFCQQNCTVKLGATSAIKWRTTKPGRRIRNLERPLAWLKAFSDIRSLPGILRGVLFSEIPFANSGSGSPVCQVRQRFAVCHTTFDDHPLKLRGTP